MPAAPDDGSWFSFLGPHFQYLVIIAAAVSLGIMAALKFRREYLQKDTSPDLTNRVIGAAWNERSDLSVIADECRKIAAIEQRRFELEQRQFDRDEDRHDDFKGVAKALVEALEGFRRAVAHDRRTTRQNRAKDAKAAGNG